MKINELLLAITRCPEIAKAREDAAHPCANIVGLQEPDGFQAPEPWRGHIDTAPILFMSSNPSIREDDPWHKEPRSDAEIIDYCQRSFDENAGQISASAYNSVRFWVEVRARATEILGRPAVPGTDFALTELVHCKSTKEQGVARAHLTCAGQWLDRVIKVSGSDIIVLLGSLARDHCAARWHLNKGQPVHFGVPTPGRERAVVILPHPNARSKRKVADFVGAGQLQKLRALPASRDLGAGGN